MRKIKIWWYSHKVKALLSELQYYVQMRDSTSDLLQKHKNKLIQLKTK